MLMASINAALALFAAALCLNVYRLFRGPDVVDRILALDTLHVNAAAVLILYGISLGSARYYEAALLIALIGFLTSAAFAKYLTRGDIIE